ncbi:aldo/keto reductase [Spirosoma utsteinense]|uniref:Diketogulonate reductase-like aldo/keto reductase n=1 Tax=Spirosoma utsteinense TaxID=2585773 RepID=A0ABR6WEN0_9BACT|nr:aldo/keto reductase [Spirosoma utsteinense]MBC3788618.1 diketogulonate reductase-like aldo/keto reductase [Spirosoma utsteinense]MBC3794749.1 diketogulonate reductase-like aldo/keto reductase [Spirosoma utsteinense]
MTIPQVTLNNGVVMPQLGLGVYAPRQNSDVQQAVEWALEAGCRLIDTAAAYGNEREVAAALRAARLPRKDVFITTKVWNSDQGYESTQRAFDRSLDRLGLDTVDLYLIHWPVKEHRLETWRALETIYADGRARAIGVCNYYGPHLDELLEQAQVTPAVNQIEWSPYCYKPEVLAYCQARNIQLEGYAPLVRGLKKDDPRLVKLAGNYGKSTFQLLVRWSLQQGVVTIPKSVKRDRIRENFDVFDFTITDEDMALMNTFYDNTRIADDPMTYL